MLKISFILSALCFLYVAFSVFAFLVIWWHYGVGWAWVFGAVACGAPTFWIHKLDALIPEDKDGDKK